MTASCPRAWAAPSCTAAWTAAPDAGYERIRLWVVKGNTRARGFYERAGFTPDGAEEPYEVDGELVPEVRYVRAVSP